MSRVRGDGLRIHVLGGLRVFDGSGNPVAIPAGRARSLLAYLVLQPDVAHPRERLADELLPDADPARGARQLIDALHRLRHALPPGLVVADRATVRLAGRVDTWVDARAFEELMRRAAPGDLAAAVELYAGELLPEVYDDWIATPRAALADAYRSALAGLAEQAEAAGAIAEAFTYYHRLTAADPLDEAGHRGLMRTYLRAGHPGAAIQQFERLTGLLDAELGLQPSAESRTIAEAARHRSAADEPVPPRPFVGRRRTRADILERIERAGGGHLEVILIEGEPGIGKSRLLEVLAEDARWRGFEVAAARVDQATSRSPYAPLDTALGSVLTTAAVDRIRRSLSPAAIDAVTGLLPYAVDRDPGRSGDRQSQERPNVAIGLGALVRALAASRPWLFLLDDVHLAGPAFWDSLRFLEEVGDVPLAMVLSSRHRELRREATGWAAMRRIDRIAAPLRVSLEPLTIAEARELATALGHRIDDLALADAHQVSDGNPLVLQQALASATPGGGRSGFVDLLDRRLAGLTPDARLGLDAAAVLGASFSLAEWVALAPDVPIAALEEVLAARFVVELPDRYALEHDLTRTHIYESIGPSRRRELHRRAASALPRGRTAAALLAWHLERAGATQEAIAGHRQAAEDAFARYAYAEALEHTDRALALDPDGAVSGPLLTLRHRVLGLQLRTAEWKAALDAAERHAIETGDQHELIDALEGRLSLHTLDGDLEAMEAAGARAVALSQELRDEAAEARVLATLGWHVSESTGDNRRALPMLRRAVRLAGEAGDEPTRVGALCMLSSAQRSMGRCRAAHVSASRAMTLVATRPHLYRGRAHALAELAETAFELGRWQDARDAMRAAVEGYRELEDPWAFGSALFGLVNITTGMGQPAEAIAAGEELVALGLRHGLAPTSDFGVWHRVSLARARLAAGDTDGARSGIADVADAVPGALRPRMALLGLLGQLELRRGQPEAALVHLGRAFELWRSRPEPRDAGYAFWSAIAAARAGQASRAREALSAGAEALAKTDMERYDVLAHLARHEVTGSKSALAAARAAITRQAARIGNAGLRTAFEQDVALHRRVAELASIGRGRPAGTRHAPAPVRLVRSGVPLGRPIRADEWVELDWPVADGDAAPDLSAVGRRRRLVELLDWARGAGATPTDDQLAAALGVSRRTVLRDIAVLRAERRPIVTRRRRA